MKSKRHSPEQVIMLNAGLQYSNRNSNRTHWHAVQPVNIRRATLVEMRGLEPLTPCVQSRCERFQDYQIITHTLVNVLMTTMDNQR